MLEVISTVRALRARVERNHGDIASSSDRREPASLLLEVFGTATSFRLHYRQLIEAVLLDEELRPEWARNTAPLPGQTARDFTALAGPIDFGEFYRGDVRRHPEIRSRNISGTLGPVRASGIAVFLPQQETGDSAPELMEHP